MFFWVFGEVWGEVLGGVWGGFVRCEGVFWEGFLVMFGRFWGGFLEVKNISKKLAKKQTNIENPYYFLVFPSCS